MSRAVPVHLQCILISIARLSVLSLITSYNNSIMGVTVDLNLQAKTGSEYFCENDVIKLFCSIQNSSILQWKSMDFIGTQESILFTSGNRVHMAKIKPQAHAILMRNEPYSSANDGRHNLSSIIYVQAIGSGSHDIECLSSDHTKQRKEVKISETPGPPTVSSTIHGNVITLLNGYCNNQTRWDLNVYQVKAIDVAGTTIRTFESFDPAINIPIMENISKIEVSTHTRCFQESVPTNIDLSAISTDSEVDDAIIPPTVPFNGVKDINCKMDLCTLLLLCSYCCWIILSFNY